ncbi:hypothetical protein FBF48_10400 [Streptococcus salivarius]|uniref:Uncharacterized protein n=1 Tax=Streptococcus salivarius TaxID=1304 RepID=A0AAX2V015_STRSL|nr:hypothetical protein [Streptococcus salivarius]TNF65644.1 hypothetical protein FBF48_10400 [Streptococcus salivarius]
MIAAWLIRFKGWLIGIGALLSALFYAWARGRSSARTEAQRNADAAQAQRNAHAADAIRQAAEDRNHVEDDIARDSRSARDRLRDDWTKPD